MTNLDKNEDALDEQGKEGICYQCILALITGLGLIAFLIWWLFF